MESITNATTGKRVIVNKCDFDCEMNWLEADSACKKLGVGWRLPSVEELRLIYSNLFEQKKGNLKGEIYWSSELCFDYQSPEEFEIIGMAIDFHMELGIALLGATASEKKNVRAVKDEKQDENSNKILFNFRKFIKTLKMK